MKISDVYNALNKIAPFSLAEEWDNCGLLLGSLDMECKTALVCLDVTEDVITQALAANAQLIISHHPVLFDPINKIDYNGKIARLVKNNIAVISAHTNLDIAENGVNDILCNRLELTPVASLQKLGNGSSLGRICKCATFENARALAKFTKEKLPTRELTFIDCQKPINTVAVCAGSGSSLCEDVINSKVDAYITGELKHNVMIDLYEAGISVIMAGHFSTEVVITQPLAKALSELLPEIKFTPAKEEGLVHGI